MSRRALLRGLLAAVTAPLLFEVLVAHAAAGTTTVRRWQWVTLPGTGLQVHCTGPPGAPVTVAVSWRQEGGTIVVTAGALRTTAGNVTMSAGHGLAVRVGG